MSDDETLAVYAAAAGTYATKFAADGARRNAEFDRFVGFIPPGGRVLDYGCGPGHWAAAFRDAGLNVDATDASPQMAATAMEKFGIEVRVEPFEALNADALYDGIWAHFSLLHATRAEFPNHLARIKRAVKPGGYILLGLKLGRGEGRDRLGRFYTYYGQDELSGLLTRAGFTPIHTRTGSEAGLSGELSDFILLTAHSNIDEAPA